MTKAFEFDRASVKYSFCTDNIHQGVWIKAGAADPAEDIVLENVKIIPPNNTNPYWVITGDRVFFEYVSAVNNPKVIDEEKYVKSPLRKVREEQRERDWEVVPGWYELRSTEPSPVKMVVAGDRVVITEGNWGNEEAVCRRTTIRRVK